MMSHDVIMSTSLQMNTYSTCIIIVDLEVDSIYY